MERSSLCEICGKDISDRRPYAKYCLICAKEKARATIREYRKKNRKRLNEYQLIWQKKNREKYNKYQRDYRSRPGIREKYKLLQRKRERKPLDNNYLKKVKETLPNQETQKAFIIDGELIDVRMDTLILRECEACGRSLPEGYEKRICLPCIMEDEFNPKTPRKRNCFSCPCVSRDIDQNLFCNFFNEKITWKTQSPKCDVIK